MEVLQIVDELEEVLERSMNCFGHSLINKENVLNLIDEIRLKLPDELKQARRIKEESENIIKDARVQADKIIDEARAKGIALIDEHEITRAANEKAAAILTKAEATTAEMENNAVAYAESLLDRVESVTADVLNQARDSKRQLRK